MMEYTHLLDFNRNKTRVSKSLKNPFTYESYLFPTGYIGFIPLCGILHGNVIFG